MNRKYKITCALTVLTLALAGCANKGVKVEDVKPNPLPKLVQAKTLVPVFSTTVASTSEADPLRLRLDVDNGVIFAINPKGNDSIYDLDIQTYFGEGFINEEMDGLKFKIGPKSFFQTNYKQALELYRKTLEFAELTGDQVVYDLYTGTGTIAQYVARNAKHVIGIEAVQEAIDAANEHAKINGLENCTFYCGDMKNVFNDEFLANHPKADVLITDPPRDGMHQKVVEQILKLAPERIVYVSCNSATQARDIALMKEDYELVKILPVDMFPQTHHVENIALLIKK